MPSSRQPELDRYQFEGGLSTQCRRAFLASPSNTADLPAYSKAIFVTSAGNICVVPVGNDDAVTVTFPVAANEVFTFCQVRRIMATGTTASGLIVGHD